MVLCENVDFKLRLGISFSKNMHSCYAVSDTATLLYNIKVPSEPHVFDNLQFNNPCNDLIINCPEEDITTRSDTVPQCTSESVFMCNTLFGQISRAHSKSDNLHKTLIKLRENSNVILRTFETKSRLKRKLSFMGDFLSALFGVSTESQLNSVKRKLNLISKHQSTQGDMFTRLAENYSKFQDNTKSAFLQCMECTSQTRQERLQ